MLVLWNPHEPLLGYEPALNIVGVGDDLAKEGVANTLEQVRLSEKVTVLEDFGSIAVVMILHNAVALLDKIESSLASRVFTKLESCRKLVLLLHLLLLPERGELLHRPRFRHSR